MKKLFLIAFAIIMAQAASAQIFEIYKMQLGYQNSASALFTCDDYRTHYSHIIAKGKTLTLFSTDRPQKDVNNSHTYRMFGQTKHGADISCQLERTSQHGNRWGMMEIETKGRNAIITLSECPDLWNGKIYYVFWAKIVNSIQ